MDGEGAEQEDADGERRDDDGVVETVPGADLGEGVEDRGEGW